MHHMVTYMLNMYMYMYTGVHLRGGGGGLCPPRTDLATLEHTGFTPVSNSCYKKPHLFIVCPP